MEVYVKRRLFILPVILNKSEITFPIIIGKVILYMRVESNMFLLVEDEIG